MRFVVTITKGATDWTVDVDGLGAPVHHVMPAVVDEDGRLWPVGDAARSPHDPDVCGAAAAAALVEIARRIEHRTANKASAADAVFAGRVLFHALLGPHVWQQIEMAAAGDDVIELGLVTSPDDGAFHRLSWEMLHDGTDHLAVRATRPVVPVRLVAGVTPAPGVLPSPPCLLFAVGNTLDDRTIRPGAELMGVLRGLQRDGGSVRTKVVTAITPTRLQQAVEQFQPDIVHVVAHGRWDGHDRRGVVELRSDVDRGAAVDVGGLELAQRLVSPTHRPTVAIVSACQSGAARSEGSGPLGAALVAGDPVLGGIPVVVAMGGDVADMACRVFTRALAAAVSAGVPLTQAVAKGRRATFIGIGPSSSSDWALPTLFASDQLPEDLVLVDAARLSTLRQRVIDLSLACKPLFCGRDEFFDHLEHLLDPTHPLALLVVTAKGGNVHHGGSRLLSELGAAAMRAGTLPCRIGPYTVGDAPTTPSAVAVRIVRAIDDLRSYLGVVPWTSSVLTALAAGGPSASPAEHFDEAPDERLRAEAKRVAAPLRDDLLALATAARAVDVDPPWCRDPVPLLLLDDAHLYDSALAAIVSDLLVPARLLRPAQGPKLPVVVFGKGDVFSGPVLAGLGGTGWREVCDLPHLLDVHGDQNVYDLAYRCWMLYPDQYVPTFPDKVFAVRPPAAEQWLKNLIATAELSRQLGDYPVFDPRLFAHVVVNSIDQDWAVSDDDTAVMSALELGA